MPPVGDIVSDLLVGGLLQQLAIVAEAEEILHRAVVSTLDNNTYVQGILKQNLGAEGGERRTYTTSHGYESADY